MGKLSPLILVIVKQFESRVAVNFDEFDLEIGQEFHHDMRCLLQDVPEKRGGELVIPGFVVVFGSALILFKGLSLFDFSKIIPLSIGINFILTSILGVVIFKEIITNYGVVGMGIILLGIIILNFN